MQPSFDPHIDYFSILGLPFGAQPDAIKRAYRQLARRFHPDLCHEPQATARFQRIAEAYRVLSQQRCVYCAHYQAHSPSGDRSQAHVAPKSRSPCPIDGKHRRLVYRLSLRCAIELLQQGFFSIPALQLRMRFTRQALEGKTFRLKGRGYPGIFGGVAGDFLLRFEIGQACEPLRLQGADVVVRFEVPRVRVNTGQPLLLETPCGAVECAIPQAVAEQNATSQLLHFAKKGLPAEAGRPASDLYVELIVT
ncbi:MAG: DnaJ domain-containing protein [Thiotrichales bacterium]|nr:DnaJ domain-containing protein [Thiotrichales bacterium]